MSFHTDRPDLMCRLWNVIPYRWRTNVHQWDYDNSAEIMHSTNALRRNNDESETKPKAKRSRMWKHVLKLIWDDKDLYTGNGITPSVPTIILPCDPITLV